MIWEKNIKIRCKRKIFHILQNWIYPQFDFFKLKTIRDTDYLLTHYWKLSMIRIKWKKIPSKSDEIKIFPYPTKWRNITLFSQFDPFYLESGRRLRKSVDILLKALNNMNQMKKILSKSGKKYFPFPTKWRKNTLLSQFDPFFFSWKRLEKEKIFWLFTESSQWDESNETVQSKTDEK